MHLIERAFGEVYDLQRRLEIAGGETAFRFRDDARDGYVIVIHPVHGVGSLYHTVLEVVQCSIS